MQLLWHTEIKNLDYYLNCPDSRIYVKDLAHQGPTLIKEAQQRGMKIYHGEAKNKSKKIEWLWHFSVGRKTSPEVKKIQFHNNCWLLDYSNFDPNLEVEEQDMEPVVNLIASYDHPITGCGVIKQLLRPGVAALTNNFTDAEKHSYSMLQQALRGGANFVLNKELIPFETHIDYHQMYAYVMTHFDFPALGAKTVAGYYPHHFGIYRIASGKAKLKPNGYPLLCSKCGTKMAGGNGQIFDLAIEIGSICDPDLKLLFKHYDVYDLNIEETLYYTIPFSGEKEFANITQKIYDGRKQSTGALKRCYKLLNEYMAGYFERTLKVSYRWTTFDAPDSDKLTRKFYNPKVGIFILAYARQMLDRLLDMIPREKVIGYDTDAVFFAGMPSDVPKIVHSCCGPEIGQFHFDAILKDVTHVASKHYYGYDLEKGEDFYKCSGVSKSGQVRRWNKKTLEYELREVNYEKR